jgi:hypothetical protein
MRPEASGLARFALSNTVFPLHCGAVRQSGLPLERLESGILTGIEWGMS